VREVQTIVPYPIQEECSVHLAHATVFVRDADRSLRFYVDGLGLEVIVDRERDGPYDELLGVESTHLRVMICGDRNRPEVGRVELLTFAEPVPDGPPPTAPATGSVILAFLVDLEAVLPALLENGATHLRRATLRRGTAVATVRDPDGVQVELIDIGAADAGAA
jgi:glyoxylase I family protein